MFSLLMFSGGDFGEFFKKQLFIKLVCIDDIFQCTKARETTAHAGGMPVKEKPGRFGPGRQNVLHAGFRNFKKIAHAEHRISHSPKPVFAPAQIAKCGLKSAFREFISQAHPRSAPDRAA